METYNVIVKDKHTGQVMTLSIGQNEHINSQEDAEAYVLAMSPSIGGKHPGLELVKDAPK